MYPKEIGIEAMLKALDRLEDMRESEPDGKGKDEINLEIKRTRDFFHDRQAAFRIRKGFDC